jgi:hypothetical protein
MITAPTSCFFMLRAESEAAQQVVAEFAPRSANDIESVVLVSADFESDVNADVSLTTSMDHITSLSCITADRLDVQSTYNPLYVPGTMSSIDETLNLDARHDNIRFVGMNGNPYTLKIIEVKDGDDTMIAAKIEYRQFEIPSYSDIVQANKSTVLN